MKTAFKILIQLVIIISFVSCEENGIFGIGDEFFEDFTENFGSPVERDFIGKVVDESSFPLSGVSIVIGDQSATTDSNGIFILKGANVFTEFAYIKARKSGYVNTSTSLIPTTGVNKVNMVMINNPTLHTVNSGSEETVSLVNGVSVKFGGAFIDIDSVAYSGRVYVRLIHLDPADSDFESKIPGMPYGENVSGREHFLESYGSLSIELEAEDGRSLYLAKDSPADITMPLNTSLQSGAPATIPLWRFNYENGYWVQEGEASLNGSSYLGTVTHVENWSFSTSSRLINFYFRLADGEDKAIANQKFDVSYSGADYPYNTKHLVTNSDGTINCIFPTNQIVDIVATNNSSCGNTTIHSSTINSTFADKDVDVLIASNSDAMTTNISGFVDLCDETPVLDGYVFLNVDGNQYFDMLIGDTYDLNMLHCSTETIFSAKAFDYENRQQSPEVSYNFVSPTTHLGNLPACNTVNEFAQYSIDGSTVKVLVTSGIQTTFVPVNIGYNAPTIGVSEQGSDAEFRLFGRLNNAPYVGTYSNYVIGDLTTTGMNIGQVIDVSDTNNNITYHFVEMGNVGEDVNIHFNGDYEDASGASHSIIGVVHVSRNVN